MIAQGASPQYSIDAGTGEFGLSNNFDMVFFVTGTGEYEGEGRSIRTCAWSATSCR